ncbi:hypothetical protein SAZ10_23035 [Mesorhizobium sp. BAC0120]|uniref:hypothetical protein n=1 Tax=Mesorhizobium sp. BAC0120 TaxID=3090670 RepID=UPI00298CEC96|nr:hypothetical protein [Mesorhizobium sp. BAC0120]MDW6024634.1 hypothetical protein [Mesorhizobium sp. BAC0120]
MECRKTLIAAALMAGAFSIPAFAGGAKVDTQQTGSTGKADTQTVMSAIDASEESSSAIRKAIEVKSVHVVDVSSLTGTGSSLETTIMRNKPKVEEVQAALQSNATLNSALEAKHVDVTKVVAADMDADGRLTVYVK